MQLYTMTLVVDIMISNTVPESLSIITQLNSSYCSSYCCFPSGIVYVSRNTVKIYQSKFEGNVGVAIHDYSVWRQHIHKQSEPIIGTVNLLITQ